MKNKIEKLYEEALVEKYSPDVFSRKILGLFSIMTEGSLSLPFNAIIHPHYDSKGHLDGGTIIENGVVKGHIDPRGAEGAQGYTGERNFLVQLADSVIFSELKKKLDKLNPDSDFAQANETNTVSFNGLEIRKFRTGDFGIQHRSKLDEGFTLDIVGDCDGVEKWINTKMRTI